MSESGVTRRDFVRTSALGLGAAALGSGAIGAPSGPADPDLVAWWTFDEAGGAAMRDAARGIDAARSTVAPRPSADVLTKSLRVTPDSVISVTP